MPKYTVQLEGYVYANVVAQTPGEAVRKACQREFGPRAWFDGWTFDRPLGPNVGRVLIAPTKRQAKRFGYVSGTLFDNIHAEVTVAGEAQPEEPEVQDEFTNLVGEALS